MIDRNSELETLMLAHVNRFLATHAEVQALARTEHPRAGLSPDDGGTAHAAYQRACELAEQAPAVVALQHRIAAQQAAGIRT